MPEPSRVVIDRVEWKSVLPVLCLSSSFKHALQPGKVLVALIAVLAIHLSGTALDRLFFGSGGGAYEELTSVYADGLQGLFAASLALNVSLDEINSVPNILWRMVAWAPIELFGEHPWFALAMAVDVLFVLAIATGILTRMNATQVCATRSTSAGIAACHVRKRWVWFVLTPLMPVAVIAVAAGLLALAGLALFSVPWLDVIGGAIFGLLLVLGFIVAFVSLLAVLGVLLATPALSVEGSDGFDAIARAFNYVLFRPWQFAAYLLASLIYLAIVYALLGLVASATISATTYFIEFGQVGDADPTNASVWIVARWGGLVAALVAAIMLSTFCCLQTQVYVLMRRSADGTPMDQCDAAGPVQLWDHESAADPDAASTPAADSAEDSPAKTEG